MKKLMAIVLAALLVFSLVACSGNTDNKQTSADDTSANAENAGKVYKVGICQLVQHDALDAATKGFQDKLTELLGEDNVEFDLQNASGDSNTCSTIVNRFVSSNVDLIMANATPALQAAVSATETIPIVGTSITDYATALNIDLDSWTGKTGINATGASDLAPLEQQAEMLMTLVPDAKKVGIIYCSGEANSKYQVNVVKEYLEAKDIEVIEYSFADSNDISAVVTKAVGECQALYIPTDNKAADNAELINNIAEPAGIPIIAGEEGICKGCGLATLSISYYDIGVAAANQAYDILVNGKNPAEMDITFSETFVKEYVKSRADALKISVPEEYKEIAE